ncbi:MAG: YpmA family protein [Bacillota bacterium]|jgi:hypothetical protein
MEEEKKSLEGLGKLDLIAVKNFPSWDHMYKIVDFLNKSLKEHNLMFGLKKGEQGTMSISIYEV